MDGGKGNRCQGQGSYEFLFGDLGRGIGEGWADEAVQRKR